MAESFATKDRQLVKALEKATADLLKHRWKGVQEKGVTDYAQQAGVSRQSVHRAAQAWELYQREVFADDTYTAVQALDATNGGVATPR